MWIILGGSDIQDALASQFTTLVSAGSQDITVTSGFGKPELIFFGGSGPNSDTATDRHAYGFAKQGEPGRSINFSQTENTASLTSTNHMNDTALRHFLNPAAATAGTLQYDFDVDTTLGNWPTDGFQVNELGGVASPVNYLALRTTAQIYTGENSVPLPQATWIITRGSRPRCDNALDAPGNDELRLPLGHSRSVWASVRGISESSPRWVGWSEDDAATTMVSASFMTSNILNFPTAAGAPGLAATGTIVGNNVRMTFGTTTGHIGKKYSMLVFGDAPAGGGGPTMIPVNQAIQSVPTHEFPGLGIYW